MTDLTDEIRSFVARDGWERDLERRHALEQSIQSRTGVPESIADLCDRAITMWGGSSAFLDFVVPFLRSRDAAALLEDAVRRARPSLNLTVTEDRRFAPSAPWESHYFDTPSVGFHCLFASCNSTSEPTARTIAALEAGYKLGMWK